MTFDDNALFRHPEIRELRDSNEEDPAETEAAKYDLSYVHLDGNIGCMVNGAGWRWRRWTSIKYYGGEPANFLDVGGGANAQQVARRSASCSPTRASRRCWSTSSAASCNATCSPRGVVDAATRGRTQRPAGRPAGRDQRRRGQARSSPSRGIKVDRRQRHDRRGAPTMVEVDRQNRTLIR